MTDSKKSRNTRIRLIKTCHLKTIMKKHTCKSQRKTPVFSRSPMLANSIKQLIQQNRQSRRNRFILPMIFLVLIALSPLIGCGGPADSKPGPKALGRAKPEGLLLVTRELDLGVIPVGGSMEAMLAMKNPSQTETIRVDRYEISLAGVQIDPRRLELVPGATGPINIIIGPEATAQSADLQCEISGWDDQNRVAFRTRFKLKVIAK